MTPLRKRMIEDMQLKGLAERTQESYAAAVQGLAKYYNKSPAEMSESEPDATVESFRLTLDDEDHTVPISPGQTLLEAAVAGVPTVGTAVGHIAEWNPEAALAVPCQDPAALADAIQLLLDDEELRMRLANEALRRASQMDADQTALAYNRLYHQLLSKN